MHDCALPLNVQCLSNRYWNQELSSLNETLTNTTLLDEITQAEVAVRAQVSNIWPAASFYVARDVLKDT